MKLPFISKAALIFAVAASTSFAAERSESFNLQTAGFTLGFQVGDDGRLYQHALGATESEKPQRNDEAYPQAGDGYVWDPAIEAVHADGDTSTAPEYTGLTRAHDGDGRELMRIQLRDPAYPFEVALCFRADTGRDMVEQWAEIRHQESGAVILQRMASTALVLRTNVFLTHFFGDWAKEMLNPITERITPGTKVLDSNSVCGPISFATRRLSCRWMGRLRKPTGRCWPGPWPGRAAFGAHSTITDTACARCAE